MEFIRKTIILLIFSSFMSVGWGQDCGDNMFWSYCGISLSCRPTCSNPNPFICTMECGMGCYCNCGYIFSDNTYSECILLQDCENCIDGVEVELWGECYNIEETTELNLSNSGLTGDIPSEIGDLSNLHYLDLRNNRLTSIPESIVNLSNLTLDYNWGITLENNSFYCEGDEQNISLIPESVISFCEQFNGSGGLFDQTCTLCDEGYTEIDGECYYQGDLDVLQIFIDNSPEIHNVQSMDDNCDGIIEPLECGSQVWDNGRLTNLSGYSSELVGTIPPEIGNLSYLEKLDLHHTQLSGEIPSEIGNLTNLIRLDLELNQLTGEIPPEIGQLTNLSYLDLHGNQLTGEIPPEIGQLTNLTYLSLYNNQLTGEIPSEIWELTNLTNLSLGPNELTGEIHPGIGNLTNLTDLSLYSNQLTGEIPPEIGNLTNLEELFLFNNQLTGEIPSEIGNLTNLFYLWLHNNQLTGEIPESICYLNLNFTNYLFKIQDNNLCPPYPDCGEGPITSEEEQDTSECSLCDEEIEVELWGVCYNIETTTSLNLSGSFQNNGELSGQIPPEIGNLTNLTGLDLGYNQLTGEIPVEIGNLTNLTHLILHSNQLTGEIPPEIGNLTNLILLYLEVNQLTGEIPPEICDLIYLDWTLDPLNPLNFVYGSFLFDNQLCPPYPECIEDYVGEQDTSECPPLSITDNLIPITYNLSSPYPNPFNPTTTISFSIPQLGMVSLNVYDITGKLVTTLINEQLNIGYHSIDWDGTNQSSGMYLVRMESGEYVKTQKLLLVK